MISISKRLKSLVRYISNTDKVIDVGCDHAKLDIYLVESGLLSKIYVCDVNPNALSSGIENIERHELSNNVIPVLSYGIEKLSELNVDTVLISGMGSKNIIEILNSPNLDRVYKLILQSNNNHNDLRRFLASKGFEIFDEEVVEDGKKTYINIVALVSDHVPEYTDIDYEFGPLLVRNPKNINYFKELRKSYETIYYASKSDEARKKLNDLEEIISSLSE